MLERLDMWMPRVVFVLFALFLAHAANAAEPIGAVRCGTCHVDVYDEWSKSAHARSLRSLTDEQRNDPTCRSCHTLAPSSPDPALVGVQCESCHGLGSDYAPENVMRDNRLARLLGLKEVTPATCEGCHEGVTARLEAIDYQAMIEAVAHRTVPKDTITPTQEQR